MAADLKLRYGEDAITDTNLLHIKRHYPNHIAIRAFNRGEEGLNGADWEWAIGRPGCWEIMRVQAKRLNVPDGEAFEGLQSKWAAKSLGERQIEVLIKKARSSQAIPIYCLYIHTSRWNEYQKKWNGLPTWSDFHYPSRSMGSTMGCMVGHAAAIRSIHRNSLEMLSPLLLPWHLLVCSAQPLQLGSLGLGPIGSAFEAHLKAAAKLGAIDYPSGKPIPKPHEELPRRFELLQDALGRDTPVSDEELVAVAKPQENLLKGMMLIRLP